MTKLNDLIQELQTLTGSELIQAINNVKIALNDISPMKDHPIDLVLWVPIADVVKNDYNPNAVAPTELKLLETSICEDGYTQPVVTWISETGREIVDGFHRSKVAKDSTTVAETLHGFLPVTTVRNRQTDKSNRMAATIRHNRARGKHSVQAMSDIVVELKRRRWSDEKIARNLGLEQDEILRLCQVTGIASVFADRDYSEAWEPAESEGPPETTIDESEVLGE